MILFYTKYNVIESFNIQSLLKLAFECVNGMRNVPASFKNILWDGSESGEWKLERNLLTYEIDSNAKVVAFRVAIVDQNDELWTTDIVLNEQTHEIQLRLAREKRIVSVEYDRNFNIPYLFKKIIREGKGGLDANLPVCEYPIFIDTHNLDIVSDLINGKKIYSLPVIYVSHPFNGNDYEIDVEELAKDMAGSAHVLVEKSSDTSIILKELTDAKNAYNGAVDIFYDDDSFRYLRWGDINTNQFRYKLSHAVYSRMAMRNIDDDNSISSIRLRNKIKKLDISNVESQIFALEIEELKEKRKEDSELLELLSDELKTFEKKVNELENANFILQNKVSALNVALNKKNNHGVDSISLEYTETEFYEDEIKRIVLECIRQTLSSYGKEEHLRRDFHILKNIFDNNSFSEMGDAIRRDIFEIFRKNKLSQSDVRNLKDLGFEIKTGSHDKYVFHGDDRYIITVSNSPSDYRGGENLAHEAINLIFGRTKTEENK